LSPRKTKASKTIEEEEKPAIALNMEELQAKIKENAEQLKKTEEPDVKDQAKGISSLTEKTKQKIDKAMARDGILGCIFRDSTSVSIDLKDPKKITDYALLSSSTVEASEQLCDIFKLGDVDQVLVDGSSARLLSFSAGDHRVCVFMEKNVDHKRIRKDLR
jgi:hypothetical protein